MNNSYRSKQLLSTNAKLSKSVEGWMILGLQLAPSTISGRNVCPNASAGCAAACLFTAGRGAMSNVMQGRINKTKWFFNHRASFMAQLHAEIAMAEFQAGYEGRKLAIRLNTISDISWEKQMHLGKNLMEHFPAVQFYDYTKNPQRALSYGLGNMPANYQLTFSRSEENEEQAKIVLANGGNVAVVFGEMPESWEGKPVISGDESDARFLDPRGVVIGLKAKGKARHDLTGFVINPLPAPKPVKKAANKKSAAILG